ncbi:DMT family transporter [Methylophaga sp.]|uniref:DMT family transporter n=1 Tax=Methylophaga sp. TaxID=2024840 RepID=UPI0025E7D7BE|nr:DMT family transporter [Methylophaga sp.]
MKVINFGAIAVMLMWALCYPLIKLSLPYAPVMITAFLRAITAGAVLIAIALLINRRFPNTIRIWVYICIIGFSGTGLGLWGMFYAGKLLNPGFATVLTNTQPLIAGVLGWYVLNEKLGKISLAGTVVGFVGIIIISTNTLFDTGETVLQGILYVFLASTGVAISNVLLKKIAGQVDVLIAMGFQLLFGSIPLAFLAFNTSDFSLLDWQLNYTLILLTLALVGTALPFVTWFWLMHRSPLYKLNVYNFLTPVFGLYLGLNFFSETLTELQWLGAGLIIVAILLVTVANGNRKSES